MADLVIVSMHEKGFPQADLYLDCGDMTCDDLETHGVVPDGFFTMKKGDPLDDAVCRARERWPAAVIVLADDDP